VLSLVYQKSYQVLNWSSHTGEALTNAKSFAIKLSVK